MSVVHSPRARRAPKAAASFTGAAAFACIIHLSCGDPSHLYQGRYYVADRDCLGTVSSLDVVAGDDTGDCSPTCLVDTHADAAEDVYVSTMCGPYPFGMDVSGSQPACKKALAAFERNDTCFSDGGSSSPAETDGGSSPDDAATRP